MSDVQRLVDLLFRLRDAGNSQIMSSGDVESLKAGNETVTQQALLEFL